MPAPSNVDRFSVAWQQFRKDHDPEPLVAAAYACTQTELAFPSLHFLAIAVGDKMLLKMVEDFGDEFGVTFEDDNCSHAGVLFDAIDEFGDAPEVIERFLERGAKINARGMNDWTPLHLASNRGYLGVVRTLVEHGADIHDKTAIDGCCTPIMEAAARGWKEVVEFLLTHGADPEQARKRAIGRKKTEMAEILERFTHKRK